VSCIEDRARLREHLLHVATDCCNCSTMFCCLICIDKLDLVDPPSSYLWWGWLVTRRKACLFNTRITCDLAPLRASVVEVSWLSSASFSWNIGGDKTANLLKRAAFRSFYTGTSLLYPRVCGPASMVFKHVVDYLQSYNCNPQWTILKKAYAVPTSTLLWN